MFASIIGKMAAKAVNGAEAAGTKLATSVVAVVEAVGEQSQVAPAKAELISATFDLAYLSGQVVGKAKADEINKEIVAMKKASAKLRKQLGVNVEESPKEGFKEAITASYKANRK